MKKFVIFISIGLVLILWGFAKFTAVQLENETEQLGLTSEKQNIEDSLSEENGPFSDQEAPRTTKTGPKVKVGEDSGETMNISKADKIIINTASISVEIADNPIEQYQGLSGRDSLCEDCGMLFVFDEARIKNFSMREMKFALDFVFIRNMKVLEVRENIRPPTETGSTAHIQSSVEADMVLELNAGFIAEHNIKPGDPVAIDQ